MKLKQNTFDVGIIVGRFQVPELHKAHIDLIQTVCNEHNKVIIFLGLSPLRVTTENPLDFEARKQMLLEAFPDVNVLYVMDQPSDEVWSKKLDENISHLISPNQTAVLYGGRDSFQRHYSGRYPTQELVQEIWISGNEIRKAISRKSVKGSADFRAGVVWASQSRFPTCYPTVDIAVFNEDLTKILLCRKEHSDKYQLIGGFADPRSASYEADARREVQEEAGIEITDPIYIGSKIIDDWRYKAEVDCIKTLLFAAKIFSGSPRPTDDIIETRWIDVDNSTILSFVTENHRELVQMALDNRKALS